VTVNELIVALDAVPYPYNGNPVLIRTPGGIGGWSGVNGIYPSGAPPAAGPPQVLITAKTVAFFPGNPAGTWKIIPLTGFFNLYTPQTLSARLQTMVASYGNAQVFLHEGYYTPLAVTGVATDPRTTSLVTAVVLQADGSGPAWNGAVPAVDP